MLLTNKEFKNDGIKKLGEYLPKAIILDYTNGTFLKYNEAFFENYISSLSYINSLNASEFRLDISIYQEFFWDKLYVKYITDKRHSNIPIYECPINKDVIECEDLISNCISKFNLIVGDITEFVDTYSKRKIILRDLI